MPLWNAAPCPRPEYGPSILFFSGGTALKETAKALVRYTHNSIHLITTFDSGGSSAALRRAFAMPAVGDMRARVMALADTGQHGAPELYALFSHRLPTDASPTALKTEWISLVQGRHSLVKRIPAPLKGFVQAQLIRFHQSVSPDFPLAGACVGNLVLTAGYLTHNHRLNSAVAFFSRILRARGTVWPIANESAHLVVRLESGEIIVGQHKFTGKETGGVNSPIVALWLTADEHSASPVSISIHPRIADTICSADAICYPIGSFYSSVVANLLPKGVGRAVATNPRIKIFVPNLGRDPELAGHSLQLQVERLLAYLLVDATGARPQDVLQVVLIDKEKGAYQGGIPETFLRDAGIATIHAPLVSEGEVTDPDLLAAALTRLSMPS